MLPDRLTHLRQKAGLTQSALAKRLHVSPSTVGMYEQGRRQPPLEILMAMAKEFGVTVDSLTGAQEGSLSSVLQHRDAVVGQLSKEELVVWMALMLME